MILKKTAESLVKSARIVVQQLVVTIVDIENKKQIYVT